MKELSPIHEVQNLLPHRYPFLMVDRIQEITIGESIIAYKNVSVNEPFFNGHFPEKPVMPGVLMIEALAQAGGMLAFRTAQEKFPERATPLMFLAGVDGARFKRIVIPGDKLILKVDVVKIKGAIWKFKGEASVEGEVACSNEFMLAAGAK